MATDLAKLIVRMEAQTAKFDASLKKSNAELKRFKKSSESALSKIDRKFKELGRSVATFAAAYLGARGIAAVISATAEAEKSFAQLQAGVKSTGGVAGYTANQLADMASALQKTTTYGDEAIQSMQAMLLTFTQIRGPVFQGATKAILDLSARMDQDLKTSAIQVGKALNDPILGVTALAKAGIQFSDAQKETIKSLVKSGQLYKAQGLILEELETQFGGSAAAARDTFGGAIDGLKNAFGDLLEAKTGIPAATREINKLADVLSRPDVKAGFDTFIGGIVGVGAAAASSVPDLFKFVALMAKASPFGPGIAALSSLKDNIGWNDPRGTKSTGPQNSRRNALPDPAQFKELAPTQKQLDEAFLMWQQGVKIKQDAIRALTALPGGGDNQANINAALAPENLRPFEVKVEEIKESISEIQVYADQAARNMQDAFAEFLFDPFEDGLKGMLKSFVDTIRKMVAQIVAQQVLTSLFGAMAGSSNPYLAAAGAAMGGVASGGGAGGGGGILGKAGGGSVTGGKAYRVGEHGVEMFIPGTSGKIIPGGGGGGVVINTSIDARGATQELAKQLPGILAAHARQTVEMARRALNDDVSRGAFGRA